MKRIWHPYWLWEDWKHVGMDKDELLRLKQITGLADLFKDREFSKAFNKE